MLGGELAGCQKLAGATDIRDVGDVDGEAVVRW